MVDIRDFQHMPLRKMMKLFTDPEDVTVDINKMAEILEVSVLPHNLSKYQVGNKKIVCAFVTNEEGNSCIFYADDATNDSKYANRVFVMMAFARYIATCQREFVITENEELLHWEKTLVSEMLMPQNEVRNTVKRLLIPTTYNLGEVFQVPQDFVRARLNDLKIPTMIAGYNY